MIFRRNYDVDYTYDLTLITNTPAQAKSQLLAPGYVVGSIDLYVNANKREFISF